MPPDTKRTVLANMNVKLIWWPLTLHKVVQQRILGEVKVLIRTVETFENVSGHFMHTNRKLTRLCQRSFYHQLSSIFQAISTQFLHRSLMNLTMKKLWKLVHFCRSYSVSNLAGKFWHTLYILAIHALKSSIILLKISLQCTEIPASANSMHHKKLNS